MSGARDKVLGAVRSALGRGPLAADQVAALDRRLVEPKPNIVPARGHLAAEDRVGLFVAEAERVNATTERLKDWADVPGRITAYLRGANLPLQVRAAPDPDLDRIPWDAEPSLEVSRGPARPDDRVSVTGAFAGIAETGTLMLLSGPGSPVTLAFLPSDHIVVVGAERIVGSYEDAWTRVRKHLGSGTLPRTVNWITGPSRTADIEQTLLLGAHGPRHLHIVIVDAPER